MTRAALSAAPRALRVIGCLAPASGFEAALPALLSAHSGCFGSPADVGIPATTPPSSWPGGLPCDPPSRITFKNHGVGQQQGGAARSGAPAAAAAAASPLLQMAPLLQRRVRTLAASSPAPSSFGFPPMTSHAAVNEAAGRASFGAAATAARCAALHAALPLRGLRTSAAPHLSTAPQQQPQQPHVPPSGTPAANTKPAPAPAPAAAATAADPVYNLPNAVSVARLVSGPVIGYWLVQGHYEAATLALAVSGASDWLDGWLARRLGASSVFGSYLDPLADKVLIGCVAGALLLNGAMPGWVAGVVVGRDLLLVAGSFAFRLRGFGWRWPGATAFFRTVDTTSSSSAAAVAPSSSALGAGGAAAAGAAAGAAAVGGAGGGGVGGGDGVSFMRPLLISKANTVLQLLLLGGYLLRGMDGGAGLQLLLPGGGGEQLVAGLEVATAATTLVSGLAYGTMAMQGKLFK
ncbi:hypothetical protein HYH02_013049 [Chlamydomonas schloesseri]|uniref:Uncharacterized protein n=1 Tax=Chlamydomonas schloesseri TaxID=2026947 RepID=A0A835W0C8_9CHLO|nr:hypothetical protein HYH02_013049 [Chlamydomonas schloesseri]|eukprot:KAG2432329.1 hypothetical protein HYH02_013049 [Chlamydomonas schloesseri]